MSFTGDLEHLSIVDVVQLLHSTRKSGTLDIMSGKGECQLVFDDGFIISANHFDNSLRIGRILVEAKVLTEESLNAALREQADAGEARKPLVATLIESGRVRKEDAYRGLETLLELTIVEVLTWKTGSFTLDVGVVTPADDYRYFPEKLQQDIQFHTENVLMDALRIYDEKKRDGTLEEIELTDELLVQEPDGDEIDAAIAEHDTPEPAAGISADDLGLADVEGLKRKIPSVFRPLEDRYVSPHRELLDRLAPAIAPAGREKLTALLDGLPPRPHRGRGAALSVILYSDDDLLAHCLGTACRHEGMFLISTSEENDIDPVVAQCRAKGGLPALVLDLPAAADPRSSPESLAGLRRRLRERHPESFTIQLAGRGGLPLPDAADDDVVAVLARPLPHERPASFVADLSGFVTAFPARLLAHAQQQRGWCVSLIAGELAALRDLRDPSAVPLALLTLLAETCGRALNLIVRGAELTPERGIGFVIAGGAAAASAREPRPLAGTPLKFPFGGPGALTEAVETGRCRWAPTQDPALAPLLARIGAPRHPAALLVPLRAGGRTVSATYADFGQREPAPVDLALIETIAAQASLALECILYRRKSEKASPREGNPTTSR